jgi:hypothetical protein
MTPTGQSFVPVGAQQARSLPRRPPSAPNGAATAHVAAILSR